MLSKYLHVKARQHTVDALKATTSLDLTTAISRKKEERLKNSKLEQEENKKQTELLPCDGRYDTLVSKYTTAIVKEEKKMQTAQDAFQDVVVQLDQATNAAWSTIARYSTSIDHLRVAKHILTHSDLLKSDDENDEHLNLYGNDVSKERSSYETLRMAMHDSLSALESKDIASMQHEVQDMFLSLRALTALRTSQLIESSKESNIDDKDINGNVSEMERVERVKVHRVMESTVVENLYSSSFFLLVVFGFVSFFPILKHPNKSFFLTHLNIWTSFTTPSYPT